MPRIKLTDQVAEIKREIAMRENVYPKWVAAGRMDKEKADRHIEVMEGVLNTIEWMIENEQAIRAAVSSEAKQ